MENKTIALVGSPNVGKTTIFNQLTGLKQKTANYPGVTVEKKFATIKRGKKQYKIIDLPGLYSMYPNSKDEEVAAEIILNPKHPDHPDLVIVVSTSESLIKSISLYQQIAALRVPAVFVLNAIDQQDQTYLEAILVKLQLFLQTQVTLVNARNKESSKELFTLFNANGKIYKDDFSVPKSLQLAVKEHQNHLNLQHEYAAWYDLASADVNDLSTERKTFLQKHKIVPKRLRIQESIQRQKIIQENIDLQEFARKKTKSFSNWLDRILIHPIFGYVIFFALLILIFQAIYSWSELPMEWIENAVLQFSSFVAEVLPPGPINQIITNGILAGIAGIVVFIPQIAILFFFIGLMEASGYMSRVVYLMDRWMKPFGLNGKSIVPLISGVACAIPAIMAARNIENQKDRLITILVTPFMTCSARLPIYAIIIALVIPDKEIGIFNLKGITLFCLYALGVVAALLVALVLKKILQSNYKSYLILEMPNYQIPVLKDVFANVMHKTWDFVWGAGRVILAVSIILWVLASFGWSKEFFEAKQTIEQAVAENGFSTTEQVTIAQTAKELIKEDAMTSDLAFARAEQQLVDNKVQALELKHSALGFLGKLIEPVIEPLGYDWKIGIGLISSFAAREVFVGTMATIYSLGSTENNNKIEEKMAKEVNSKTGKPVYNLYTGLSLLVFYAFAMQCMSTLAIVKKETNSWKWPIIQTVFMTVLAYISALITYQVFS